MSSMFDTIKKSAPFKWFVSLYIRLLFMTYRIDLTVDDDLDLESALQSGIFYFWRRDIVAGVFFLERTPLHIRHFVTDHSPDGELAAYVGTQLGFKILYGAAKPSFIRKALDVLEMNKQIVMIGDGASSDPQTLHRELLYLSAKSEVPLVHIQCRASFALSLRKRLDKLRIPLPFSTIHIRLKRPQAAEFDSHNDPVIPE